MGLRLTWAAFAAVSATLAAGGANAVVLVNQPHSPTTPQATETSIEVDFQSTGGAGDAAFTIDGYRTLDGFVGGASNGEDDFSLTLNGVLLLKGTFNLGGGGQNIVFQAPGDAAFTALTPNAPFGTGGKEGVTTSLNLAAGANALVFSYHAVTGAGFLGFQGFADEAWGIEDLVVDGAGEAAPPLPSPPPPPPIQPGPNGGTPGVPEPQVWTLMILGFGSVGAMVRRRRPIFGA